MSFLHPPQESSHRQNPPPSIDTMAMPHHPFSNVVMQDLLPSCFEPPKITKYERFSDLEDHPETFTAHMLMYGSVATNPLFCRAFLCTLTNYRLRWSFSLPPRSIDNFSQLSCKFLTLFALSKTYRKTEEFLIDMYQPYSGPLQEYVSRFNRVAMQIDNFDALLYVQKVRECLVPRDFLNSLHSEPPLTQDDVWKRAKGFLEKRSC